MYFFFSLITALLNQPLSCWINKDVTPTSNFQQISLIDLDCCCKFTYLMANSADPDQLASSEANWSGSTLFAQKQGISGLSRKRVKTKEYVPKWRKFFPLRVDTFPEWEKFSYFPWKCILYFFFFWFSQKHLKPCLLRKISEIGKSRKSSGVQGNFVQNFQGNRYSPWTVTTLTPLCWIDSSTLTLGQIHFLHNKELPCLKEAFELNANSVNPDQTAAFCGVWSGSILFPMSHLWDARLERIKTSADWFGHLMFCLLHLVLSCMPA